MKSKKDWILIVVLFAAALLLIAWGRAERSGFSLSPATPSPELDERYSEELRQTAAAYLESNPADSYLIVTTASGVYSPIPLNQDGSFRIGQADGSENIIHIGKDCFWMESANCDNQNCIAQGEVTLENRESRVLFNMVICLPHNLSLELLDRAETEALLLEMLAQEAGET